MKEENTELVKTGGIFYKIQNFFKKIFNKKNKEREKEDINKKEEVEEKVSFKETITIKEDSERERLTKLQEKFRNNELGPNDISNEDIQKLGALYDEQIAETEEKIKETIKKIEQIREKKQKKA